MEQLVMFAIGLPTFMLVWRFIVQRTILDHHRDKLFDLRDRLRADFERLNALDTPLYKELRSLINTYLRNTEELNIWGVTYMESAVSNDKALVQHLRESLERRFRSDRPELQEIVRSVRAKAYETGVSYMIFSSLFCTVLAGILMPIFAAKILIETAYSKVGKEMASVLRQMGQSFQSPQRSIESLLSASRAAVLAMVISPVAIEAATPTPSTLGRPSTIFPGAI